jgi:Ser/Thr protein kinase RdoA (MazF antagonist)
MARRMTNLNTLLTSLPPEERDDFYLRCAHQVLTHYALDTMTPHFIQHNAGVVFRLDDGTGQPQAMLKIHENAGDSGNDTPEQIEAQLGCLAALAEQSGIIVQSPITNRAGGMVAMVHFAGVDRPVACTVQQWISGEHAEQWLPVHAHAIGTLLATIHNHSERWSTADNEQLGRCGATEVQEAFTTVCGTVEFGLIDEAQRAIVESTGERCAAVIEQAGETPNVWGVVHGDLHQGNVFFVDGKPAPIDFNMFRAHYLYDLGVSLYHASFDDLSIRQALVEGYASLRPLSATAIASLEAYTIMAATLNLAFQAMLPNHRLSPINRRNMIHFAERFCRKFVYGEPFLFV